MKKLLLLFLVAVGCLTASAKSFTISFKNQDTESDASAAISLSNSTDYTKLIESGSDYLSSISSSYVYLGRKDHGIKMASGNNGGSVTLNLAADYQVVPTSIVVNAADYGTKNPTINVNDWSFTIESGATEMTDYTITCTNAAKLTSIKISNAKGKQCFVKSITVNYEAADPGLTDPEITYGENADVTFLYGNTPVLPTLVNANGLEVAYSIDCNPANVASINATTGAVAINEDNIYGIATVTASWGAQTIAGVKYSAGSASYTINVLNPNVDSVTFTAGTDKGSSTDQTADAMYSYVVSINSTSAALAQTQYRIYTGSITTFSSPVNITEIVFEKDGNSYLPSSFALVEGQSGTYNTETYTWTGSAKEIKLKPSAQVRAKSIKVTFEKPEELYLTDEAGFYGHQTHIVDFVTYTRVVDMSNWHAVCLPFDVKYVDWSKDYKVLKLHSEQDDNMNTVTFKYLVENEAMEANTPYLIKAAKEGVEGIELIATDATLQPAQAKTVTEGAHSFTGVYEPMVLTEADYALAGGVFKHGDNTKTLKPFRAYLTIDGAQNAPAMRLVVDGEESGIESIKAEAAEDGVFYNLQGQRVDNPAAGLYIFNGRKVVIK